MCHLLRRKACISGESYIPLIVPLAFLFVLLVDPRHPKEDGDHWDLQMNDLNGCCIGARHPYVDGEVSSIFLLVTSGSVLLLLSTRFPLSVCVELQLTC